MNHKITTLLFVAAATGAQGATFNIATAADVFAPSERGSANSTYVGWDIFDDGGAGDGIIDDQTPDLGSGAGSLATTNGESHISSSMNFYSGGGSVAETVGFETDGMPGEGFTTIIAQGKTLFGGFGTAIEFSDILGATPEVIQGTNAQGSGQFWAKWEVPGNQTNLSFDLSTGPGSRISLDKVTVDTSWSLEGFSDDTAVVPEPSALALSLGALALAVRRRR